MNNPDQIQIDLSRFSYCAELSMAIELIRLMKALWPDRDVFIVGGAPRDLLLGHNPLDVDLATNIPLSDLEERFSSYDISKGGSQPVHGIDFGGFSFEIAALREDSGDHGRQNNVATLTDSIEVDSRRRDITINSLAMDEAGLVYDFHGGAGDLLARKIRCVGEPSDRFHEDAVRILRVFRFAARLDYEIDFKTYIRALQCSHLLKDREAISPEAISKELFKAARNGRVLARFIYLLCKSGLIKIILPEFAALDGFTHDPEHHPEGGSLVQGHILACLEASECDSAVVNLGILFHDLGKAVTRGTKENGHSNYHGHEAAGVPIVEGIFERLRFPDLNHEQKEAILLAVGRHMLIHSLDDLSIRTLTKISHHPGWEVLVAVAEADEASRGPLHFNQEKFNEKIVRATQRVAKIAVSDDTLRKKLKSYIDGNKVISWFPSEIAADRKLTGQILDYCTTFILEKLDSGVEPTEREIYHKAQIFVYPNEFRD